MSNIYRAVFLTIASICCLLTSRAEAQPANQNYVETEVGIPFMQNFTAEEYGFLHYPGEPNGNAYFKRLVKDASPEVRTILQAHRPN